MKKAKYTPDQIAEWFIWYNNLVAKTTCGDLMTNSRLERMLYYAQGASLALHNRPLFSEDFIKGEYGALLPSIHKKYRFNWFYGINEEVSPEGVKKEDQKLLLIVYDLFGKYSARGLSLLNREDSAVASTDQNAVIPKDKIRFSFEAKYLFQLMHPEEATNAEKSDWNQLRPFFE